MQDIKIFDVQIFNTGDTQSNLLAMAERPKERFEKICANEPTVT